MQSSAKQIESGQPHDEVGLGNTGVWGTQAELDGIFGDVTQVASRDESVRWVVAFATHMTTLGIRTSPAMLISVAASLDITHGYKDPRDVAEAGIRVRIKSAA